MNDEMKIDVSKTPVKLVKYTDREATECRIPECVQVIGREAFRDCISLQHIEIPEGITEIEENAFFGCTSLQSVKIPDSVTKIGDGAFSGCASLRSITIPRNLKSFIVSSENPIFGGCFNLSEIQLYNIPDIYGDFEIHFDANYNLITPRYQSENDRERLSFSELFPDSVIQHLIYTGDNFSAWTMNENLKKNLLSITVPEDHPAYYSRDGILYDKDCRTLLCCPGKIARLTIPDSVTEIGAYACDNCAGLQSVVIPDSVTKIGSCAFSDCTALQSIVIPDSVTEIQGNAFSYCTALQSIVIPNDLHTFGNHVFYCCPNIREINGIEMDIAKMCEDNYKILEEKNDNLIQNAIYYDSDTGEEIIYRYDEDYKWNLASFSEYVIATIIGLILMINLKAIDYAAETAVIRELPGGYESYHDLDVGAKYLYEPQRYEILCKILDKNVQGGTVSPLLQKKFKELFESVIDHKSEYRVKLIQKMMDTRLLFNSENIADCIEYAISKGETEIQVMLCNYKNEYIGYPDEDIPKKFQL